MTDKIDPRIDELILRRMEILQGGGTERIEKQHEMGKLTARERLDLLFDPDSFEELNLFAQHRVTDLGLEHKEFPADGVITGYGKIDGRNVYAFAQDFTVAGGAAGEMHEKKIAILMNMAMRTRSPFIGINDSGGARIQEGALSLSGYGEIFYLNTLLSGVVPQIAIIAGPCAGGAAYSPTIMDFVVMIKGISRMFVTGPENVKHCLGEVISSEELGGAMVHATKSGVCHILADNEEDALARVKQLLSYLPSSNSQPPPHAPQQPYDLDDVPELNHIVPADSKTPFDMKEIIELLVDPESFLEIQPHYAANVIIGFSRINGYVAGIVANQPMVEQGYLDADASCKATRFVRFCNCFEIPIINLVDVPGFVPGAEAEHHGILRHGAKLLFALSASTMPKITVIVRKAYGGTFLAMGVKSMGQDRVLAWPSAEIAVLDSETAARIIYHDELKASPDPVGDLARRCDEYRRTFCNPFNAAANLIIDDVIIPSRTRRHLTLALDALHTKQVIRPHKKHGNIPL